MCLAQRGCTEQNLVDRTAGAADSPRVDIYILGVDLNRDVKKNTGSRKIDQHLLHESAATSES